MLFMCPGDFPVEDGARPCEVNTDTVYFPELWKPSAALHKVKVKAPNMLYQSTQLSAAAPHIWRLPVADTELRRARPTPHGVLCCIFKFHWNVKVGYDT